jgi:hypothetical protein
MEDRNGNEANQRLQHHFEQAFFVVVKALEPACAFGERSHGAEQRLDLDAAVLNAADRLRIFARAGAGAFDRDLARDDFLKREGGVGLEIANENTCPPLRTLRIARSSGAASADDFKARVGAVTTADLADVHGQAFLLGVENLLRAQLAGQFEAFVVEIDGDHLFPAACLEALE